MTREPNAVDFWRGFALITIFIDHIPGLIYERYTLVNYSISDAADLFVFLAGWSLRLMADGGGRLMPTRDVTAAKDAARDRARFRPAGADRQEGHRRVGDERHRLRQSTAARMEQRRRVFNDPVPTHIGLVLLTHQLGYFDILPLYVVLMLMAPLFALIDRTAPHLLLPASATLYVCALTFRLTLPTWPVSGTWFFNPLAWQFVFVLGFVFARDDHGMGALARRYIVWLRILAMPVVILGTLIVWFPLWLDPTHAPEPKLFFMIDKTYVTPIRLTQFLSVVAVFSLTFRYIRWLADARYARHLVSPLIRMLAMLGRNSLYVFCVGSLLSLSGQVMHFIYRGSVVVDSAVVVFGIVIMAFTAWLAESRQRARPTSPAPWA
jgi:hypothetical protein